METWLSQTFPILPNGQVLVFQDAPSLLIAYDPANAATNFPSVAVVPTHAALSGLAIAKQGWQKIFDQWKANGIIT